MKILFISNWYPYPPINGAKIRIYNLIRQLARHHEIDLVSFTQTIPLEDAQASKPSLRQYCASVDIFPKRPFDPGLTFLLQNIFSPYPRSVSQSYNPEIDQLIRGKIKSKPYDVIIASEVNAPSVVSYLATKTERLPVVLDGIEVGVEKNAFSEAKSSLTRLRRGLTWWRLKNFTKMLLEGCSIVTVPSQLEKDNLLSISPASDKIRIIPHCLDLDDFTQDYGLAEPETIVFTGSFTYRANADAVIFFLDRIYPLIKAERPGLQLKIVGSTDGVDLTRWSGDRSIEFTGLLKDVKPAVARSWMSIVPLRIGGGTRLKIIESMALGTPVVSTSRGAEGLEVVSGDSILIADEPGQFAQAVLDILKNQALHDRLSNGGLALVKERYSADGLGEKYESLLQAIASNPHHNRL
jgi:glycosyltransferase involved in cell wall biosynthesis